MCVFYSYSSRCVSQSQLYQQREWFCMILFAWSLVWFTYRHSLDHNFCDFTAMSGEKFLRFSASCVNWPTPGYSRPILYFFSDEEKMLHVSDNSILFSLKSFASCFQVIIWLLLLPWSISMCLGISKSCQCQELGVFEIGTVYAAACAGGNCKLVIAHHYVKLGLDHEFFLK